ncbi:MAG: DUF1289 domain-containing protein [Pseudomonadota bacterium]
MRMCTLDRDDICVGCGRTLKEIKAWSNSSYAEKNKILDNIANRARRPSPRLKPL